MVLNHIDLQVPDVQLTAAYFSTHFGFERLGNQHSPAIAILQGEGPVTLVLQQLTDPSERYPTGFHVGFILESPEAVRAQHAAMKERGAVIGDVEVNGRGTMFYLRAPGDVTIEVSCRKRIGNVSK